MWRGLYLGRFNPFHFGHMGVLAQMYEDCDEIIMVVGSAEKNFERDNPFTAGERIEMISAACESEDYPHYIIPVQDTHNSVAWVAHVVSLVPAFDVVYTNNPITEELFVDAGYPVENPIPINTAMFSGTEVRKTMRGEGQYPLSYMLHKSVIDFLEEIHGTSRVKRIG